MPCARCKHMKKRCGQDCEFAQHFPAEEHQKFADIHLVFGADNFMNMLKVQHPSPLLLRFFEAVFRVKF